MSSPQRPFGGFLGFWIVGILAAKVPLPTALAGVFLAGSGVVAVVFQLRRRRIPVFVLGSLLIGCSYFYCVFLGRVAADDISRLVWERRISGMSLEGTVAGDLRQSARGRGPKTSFSLVLDRCQLNGFRPCSGKILVNLFQSEEVREGDRLRLTGTLHRPFEFDPTGKFSYRAYLEGRGIHFMMSVGKLGKIKRLGTEERYRLFRWISGWRERFSNTYSKYLDPQSAGLMKALVLGVRTDIAPQVNNLFVVTGTTHILAVSGFNVGIVAFMVLLALKVLRIPRRAQYGLTIAFLIFYSLLTGGQAPVVRATIMGIVFLLGFLLERKPDPLNSLAFSAWLILIWNPRELFGVGFQLSFASVLFIMLLYPRLLRSFSDGGEWLRVQFDQVSAVRKGRPRRLPWVVLGSGAARLGDFILKSLGVSLAAWWGVLGLIAFYFLMITPVTILANLVVVPLVSLLTVLGIGFLESDVLVPGLSIYWADCCSLLLNTLIRTVHFFSLIPGGCFYLTNVSIWQVVIYYSFWLMFFVWDQRRILPQPSIDKEKLP